MSLVLRDAADPGSPVLDTAGHPELGPTAEARLASRPPIDEADVLAVARLLAAWDGDLRTPRRGPRRRPRGASRLTEPAAPDRDAAAAPSFAHASEAELARILDFYDVRWAYEPDTFPIGWNLDGDVVESFSPDFYLPDLDLYVELTTLKQKLVRKKNRKLRRLRELYPDVQIKLFYARDFRQLLLKFGRLALVDELTGTTGQSTPPRATADVTAEAAADPAIAARLAVREADAELADPPAPSPRQPPPIARPPPWRPRAASSEPGAPAARGRRRGRRRRRPAG